MVMYVLKLARGPFSFPEAALLLVSAKTRDLWKGPTLKSAIQGLSFVLRMLRVKSDKSDWLRIRNDYSAHSLKMGLSQRTRFLALTKRSGAS